MTLGLPRRADLDPRAVLAGMAPEHSGAALRELGEGFDNVVWAVGERLCLRVSKTADAGTRAHEAARDADLLSLVAAHVTVPTNRVVAVHPEEGALLMTLLAGPTADLVRPTDPRRVAATLGRLLDELAAVPVDAAARLVPPERSRADTVAETAAAWREAATLLPAGDRRSVERFLDRPPPERSGHHVLVHHDLRDEHLVMRPDGADLLGVIDWSDAVLGDPARDLACVALDLGPAVLDLVLETLGRSADHDLRARALWEAARAGVEGVAYRAVHGRPSLPTALTALRQVLAEPW